MRRKIVSEMNFKKLTRYYSKRVGKSISSLSMLGNTAGTPNKWALWLDLDEVSVHIMPRKFRLSVCVTTVVQTSPVRHIADVEYLLWQREVCAAASGLVKKKIEFNLLVRHCIPIQPLLKSYFLDIPLHLNAFPQRSLGKDQAQDRNGSPPVWTKLSLNSINLIFNFEVTTRLYTGVCRQGV